MEILIDEKADWADRLIKLGLSQSEISRRSTVPQNTISNWLLGKREADSGVFIDKNLDDSRDDGMMKTVIVKHVLGDDLEAKKAIAYATSIKIEALRQLGDMLKDTPRAAARFDDGNKKVPSLNDNPTVINRHLHKKFTDQLVSNAIIAHVGRVSVASKAVNLVCAGSTPARSTLL